jgi:hypothetical protein
VEQHKIDPRWILPLDTQPRCDRLPMPDLLGYIFSLRMIIVGFSLYLLYGFRKVCPSNTRCAHHIRLVNIYIYPCAYASVPATVLKGRRDKHQRIASQVFTSVLKVKYTYCVNRESNRLSPSKCQDKAPWHQKTSFGTANTSTSRICRFSSVLIFKTV